MAVIGFLGPAAAQLVALQWTPQLEAEQWSLWTWITTFVNTPAPYSPFTEYLALIFLFWLLALRGRRRTDFAKKAQEVLDEKYEAGELSQKTYDKFRQDAELRPKY